MDRNVFMHFAPSMVTHAAHAAKPANPKQTPGYNGYIPGFHISPVCAIPLQSTTPNS
jgi:hypothetical protein